MPTQHQVSGIKHRAPARPTLYGPTGKALSYGLYPSPRREGLNKYRPRPSLSGASFRKKVSDYDRCELLDYSQQLYSQVANLGSSINEKNSWAFLDAWEPHYIGNNTPWGEEAQYFLSKQFFPNCDRHGRFDWKTLLYLSGIAWDRDGDDLMLLTEDSGGFPKVEIIPASRIGTGRVGITGQPAAALNRGNGQPIVLRGYGNELRRIDGGMFDGALIFDGIIFNDAGTPVGVRVLGEDLESNGRTSSASRYQDYSLGYGGNADLAYLPEWSAQGRGIPLVSRVVLDWLDLQDIDDFLKRGIKRAASVGLTSHTAEAEAGMGNEILTEEEVEVDTDGDGATDETEHVTYEEIEGGEMYYLRADGEEIKGIKYENPHPNVETYIARIERRAVRAVGWCYELLYLGATGRGPTRLVCRFGNQSIWKQQSLGLRRTWRAARYALAKAQNRGIIRRNPDPRDAYFAWDFGLPAPISVDEGNDEQADRENLKIGNTTKAIIAQKKGLYWQEIRRQRKAEIQAAIADAEELVKTSGGKLTFDRALELLEQRTANGALASAPQKPSPPKDDKK